MNSKKAKAPFFVLNNPGQSELIVKQSRFIGFSERLIAGDDTEDALKEKATQRINEIRKEFHDARHVCFAYRIKKEGSAEQIYEKYTDDGEPNRTGGFPILQLLQTQKLENSIAIVVRYFGGVKLGTGGLARAYRQCAQESILQSSVLEIVPQRELLWEISYDLLGSLEHWLKERPTITIKEKDFGQKIQLKFEIRADSFDPTTRELAKFLQISHQSLTK